MIGTDTLVSRIRDHGVALMIGVLVGVLGHMAWQRVDDFSFGKDPLAYVDVVDDLHPIGPSRDAMLERLDLQTGREWDLTSTARSRWCRGR